MHGVRRGMVHKQSGRRTGGGANKYSWYGSRFEPAPEGFNGRLCHKLSLLEVPFTLFVCQPDMSSLILMYLYLYRVSIPAFLYAFVDQPPICATSTCPATTEAKGAAGTMGRGHQLGAISAV